MVKDFTNIKNEKTKIVNSKILIEYIRDKLQTANIIIAK